MAVDGIYAFVVSKIVALNDLNNIMAHYNHCMAFFCGKGMFRSLPNPARPTLSATEILPADSCF